jgi:hypothetical protein
VTIRSFETSETIKPDTWRHIPEDLNHTQSTSQHPKPSIIVRSIRIIMTVVAETMDFLSVFTQTF